MADPHDSPDADIDLAEPLLRAIATLPIRELRELAASWPDDDLERLLVAVQPADPAAGAVRQIQVTRRRNPESAGN
jgi:hypothetical protein